MFNELDGLLESISGLEVDLTGTENQTVDTALIEKYESRFKMGYEDNCPKVITDYLELLLHDTSVNDITRAHILKKGLEYQTMYFNKGKCNEEV